MAVSPLSESHGVMRARPNSGRSLSLAASARSLSPIPDPRSPSSSTPAARRRRLRLRLRRCGRPWGPSASWGASSAPGSASQRRRDESRRERVRVRRRARASGPGWVPSWIGGRRVISAVVDRPRACGHHHRWHRRGGPGRVRRREEDKETPAPGPGRPAADGPLRAGSVPRGPVPDGASGDLAGERPQARVESPAVALPRRRTRWTPCWRSAL